MRSNFFDSLDVISNILQILNYWENKQQTSNDKIMKELQHQNTEFLEQILNNQIEILNKIERLENARKIT
jgi:uncharacterized protein (DUF608 family)